MSTFDRFKGWIASNRVKGIMARSTDRPLYYVHQRKTAGTSLNIGIIQALVGSRADKVYSDLASAPAHVVCCCRFSFKAFPTLCFDFYFLTLRINNGSTRCLVGNVANDAYSFNSFYLFIIGLRNGE